MIYELHASVYLVSLFGKSEKANLSNAERAAAKAVLKGIQDELSKGGRG